MNAVRDPKALWFLWSEGGHHGTKGPKEMSNGTDATAVKARVPGGPPWGVLAGGCLCAGLIQMSWPDPGRQQVSLQCACQGHPLVSTLGSFKEPWGLDLPGCLLYSDASVVLNPHCVPLLSSCPGVGIWAGCPPPTEALRPSAGAAVCGGVPGTCLLWASGCSDQ